MKNIDYQNYDYLDIIVKIENKNEIVSSYSSFLWEKIDEKEDKRYNDVVHLSFRRPHNLQNKDRLQLLQVYYESALNSKSDLKTKKHSKSTGDICALATILAILLFGVGVFIYLNKTLFSIILGAVIVIFLLGAGIYFTDKIKKVFIKENKAFSQKTSQIQDEIANILTEVNCLTKKSIFSEGENEKV